jgi:hypothetical protein
LALRLAKTVAVAHRLGLCDPHCEELPLGVSEGLAETELLWLRESVSEAVMQAVAVTEGETVTEEGALGESVKDESKDRVEFEEEEGVDEAQEEGLTLPRCPAAAPAVGVELPVPDSLRDSLEDDVRVPLLEGERDRVAQWLPLKEGEGEVVLDGLCEVHAEELRLPEPELVPVPLPKTEKEMLPEAVRERAGERVAETERDSCAEGVCEALALTVREALLQPVALRVPELQGEAMAQPLALALVEGLSVAEEVGLCVGEVVPLTLLDAQSVAVTEAEGLPVLETVLETEPEAHTE